MAAKERSPESESLVPRNIHNDFAGQLAMRGVLSSMDFFVFLDKKRKWKKQKSSS